MSGIPDGLGAYRSEARRRLTTTTGATTRHRGHEPRARQELPEPPPARAWTRASRGSRSTARTTACSTRSTCSTGNEGFERFCSATLMTDRRRSRSTSRARRPCRSPGQPPGAAHDGSSIVMDPETGMWVETAHFGHFQHENVVPHRAPQEVGLPDERGRLPARAASPTCTPTSRTTSTAAIRGRRRAACTSGRPTTPPRTGTPTVPKGESIPGTLRPDHAGGERELRRTLKDAATAKDAFKFDRLEDIAVRPDVRGRTYIADTGKPPHDGARPRLPVRHQPAATRRRRR